jgi:hypothetical protein
VGKGQAPQAGRWAQLTAEALTVYMRRAGVNTTELRVGAGLSYGYYSARMSGRMPFSLNDVEVLCEPLGVSPLEVAEMATMLGKVTSREDEAREDARVAQHERSAGIPR